MARVIHMKTSGFLENNTSVHSDEFNYSFRAHILAERLFRGNLSGSIGRINTLGIVEMGLVIRASRED